MNRNFKVLKGELTREEFVALRRTLPTPIEKKSESASLWRKSQIRQPLPRKWGQTF
jgi:hypothetical protein